MFTGLIIEESLKDLDFLSNLEITIIKEEIWKVGSRAVLWQPKVWTAIYIEGSETYIAEFARQISASILDKWYANLSDSTTEYVIFYQKKFAYLHGDDNAKQKAQRYGASIGVPEHQLDW